MTSINFFCKHYYGSKTKFLLNCTINSHGLFFGRLSHGNSYTTSDVMINIAGLQFMNRWRPWSLIFTVVCLYKNALVSFNDVRLYLYSPVQEKASGRRYVRTNSKEEKTTSHGIYSLSTGTAGACLSYLAVPRRRSQRFVGKESGLRGRQSSGQSACVRISNLFSSMFC